MYIAAMIRSLGPVKFILSAIFVFLPAVELLNGVLAIDDLVATMMLLVVLNDLYTHHWKAFFRTNLGLPSFLAGRHVNGISNISLEQVKHVQFVGKLPAHKYLFSSKRALVFQEFFRPSECAVNKGTGKDPHMNTTIMERTLKLQMVMGFVFLSILGLAQLTVYYTWLEGIILPLVSIAWIVALVFDMRKKKMYWGRGFKLIYVNLAMIVFVGAVLQLT